MNRLTILLTCLLLIQCNQEGWSQRVQPAGPTDSGGPLMEEQAAYDVTYYDLAVNVKPETKELEGILEVHARVLEPIEDFVLDLDTVFTIATVELSGVGSEAESLSFENRDGKLWIKLPGTKEPGEEIIARVKYQGKPRVARRPPWSGGFVWSRTSDGDPWIATAVQGEGADLWWPCKDHPSDEPDSMALHITVPENLVAASNGRLRSVSGGNGQKTYHWFVSTPINNYGVALNIAPYEKVEDVYHSISGQDIPVTFWVLPSRYEEAKRLLPEFIDHLAFFEKHLGPYPFREEKYGVAHVPFLGMEHQTIIAYGSNFGNDARGYDWLHHHELSHEWWGNMVTAADWRDFWIHEGFGTYMQALYSQELYGYEGYLRELESYRNALLNLKPVAPRESYTTDEMYFVDANQGIPDNDIYYKGSWVLHTLRYLIGDEAFFKALRRMAYPDPELEKISDGRQCRFATTDDFLLLVEEITGEELDWFFEVYLRQPEIPRLKVERRETELRLSWEVPGDLTFPMPVEVQIGDEIRRIEMPDGRAVIEIAATDPEPVIDPNHRVLKDIK